MREATPAGLNCLFVWGWRLDSSDLWQGERSPPRRSSSPPRRELQRPRPRPSFVAPEIDDDEEQAVDVEAVAVESQEHATEDEGLDEEFVVGRVGDDHFGL